MQEGNKTQNEAITTTTVQIEEEKEENRDLCKNNRLTDVEGGNSVEDPEPEEQTGRDLQLKHFCGSAVLTLPTLPFQVGTLLSQVRDRRRR